MPDVSVSLTHRIQTEQCSGSIAVLTWQANGQSVAALTWPVNSGSLAALTQKINPSCIVTYILLNRIELTLPWIDFTVWYSDFTLPPKAYF